MFIVRHYDWSQVFHEFWSFCCRYVPHDDIVHVRIVMDESVPHPGDLLPFDRCNLIAYLVRDFLGRFAYNFNATYEARFWISSRMKDSKDMCDACAVRNSASWRMSRRISSVEGCIANGRQY